MQKRLLSFAVIIVAACFFAFASAGPPPDTPDCPCDVNGDAMVDVTDLVAVLGDWGPCTGCPTDFDGDDTVDVYDLLAVLGDWGVCP